jgi:hypothetical protein
MLQVLEPYPRAIGWPSKRMSYLVAYSGSEGARKVEEDLNGAK